MAVPSRAHVDFVTALGFAQSLLALEAEYADPPEPAHIEIVAALRGGAAVLMVAAFERFLRDLMHEGFSAVSQDPPALPLSALPEEVRHHSVSQSFRNADRSSIYGASRSKADRYRAIITAANRAVADRVDPEAFAATNSNPGPDTVKEMFSNAGLPQVFAAVRPTFDALWPKPEAVNYLHEKLNEIVLRRNSVAHTADVLRISRVDLRDAVAFLDTLTPALDAEFERHIQGLATVAEARHRES